MSEGQTRTDPILEEKSPGKLRNDSISNYLNGIGSPADASTKGRPTLEGRLKPGELEKLYLQNDLARRIVDELVEDSTRGGWMATVDGEPVEEPEHLDIHDTILEAGKLGRLYGAGLIMAVHGKGGSYDSEMDPLTAGVPDNIVIMDRHEASVQSRIRELSDPNFGEPETYSISPNYGNVLSKPAHRSRVKVLGGAPLPRRLRDLNDGFDDSTLQAVWDVLRNFTQTETAIAGIIQRFETATISIAGLADVLQGDEGLELIQKRMRLFQQSISQINAALIDADAGEQYSRQYATVTGLDTLWDRLAHSVSKAARMPMTQLFGMSPSGLSSDDESGKANWRKQVASYQNNELRPVLEWYYAMITGRDDVVITFAALDETTAREEAEIEKLRAEARAIYIDRRVATPNEVRAQVVDDGLIRGMTGDPDEENLAELDDILDDGAEDESDDDESEPPESRPDSDRAAP